MINIGLALCSGVANSDHSRDCDVDVWRGNAFLQLRQPTGFLLWYPMEPGISVPLAVLKAVMVYCHCYGARFMVSGIALLVAVPVGLMIAIYLAEYASPRFRSWAKPTIEVLAGIPTIVYGVFALMIIGPFLKSMGASGRT